MKWLLSLLLISACSRSSIPVYDASIDFIQTSGADVFVSFVPGPGGDPQEKGTLAIGNPDGMVAQLGEKGVLTLGVSRTIVSSLGDGPDVVIILAGTAMALENLEAVVYAARGEGEAEFQFVDTIDGMNTQVDLGNASGLTEVTYVRIVATKGNIPVDAIQVLHYGFAKRQHAAPNAYLASTISAPACQRLDGSCEKWGGGKLWLPELPGERSAQRVFLSIDEKLNGYSGDFVGGGQNRGAWELVRGLL